MSEARALRLHILAAATIMLAGKIAGVGRSRSVAENLKIECRVHGFRSSFRSWCSDGVDQEMAEQALRQTCRPQSSRGAQLKSKGTGSDSNMTSVPGRNACTFSVCLELASMPRSHK